MHLHSTAISARAVKIVGWLDVIWHGGCLNCFAETVIVCCIKSIRLADKLCSPMRIFSFYSKYIFLIQTVTWDKKWHQA